jgi:nucleoside-diphosphate-sugar epimerase
MKTLVLGASGHIGRRLLDKLKATDWAQPIAASRRRGQPNGNHHVQVDALDLKGLSAALVGCDCVVNCVAGDFKSIATGAENLVRASLAAGCKRIVHLSTMSVYGGAEGTVTEQHRLDPSLGWYARAKCEAEETIRSFAQTGGQAVILRPGCVFGAGSQLWVGRIGRWLLAGRLGDLGVGGDGWSNLVHVDDVCEAVLAAIRLAVGRGDLPVFNLAAPDSPRWNDYFVDLALAIGATPVRRISARQLRFDAMLAGPPLKIIEKLLDKLRVPHAWLPDPLPPSLGRLWSRQIRLDARAVERLPLRWTSYDAGLRDSVEWFRRCEVAH